MRTLTPRLLLLAFSVFCLLAFTRDAQAQSKKQKPSPTQAAQPATKAWLALMDAGKYAESWATASPAFQAAITQDGWIAAAKQVRDPLGAVQSRVQSHAVYTKTLLNAPAGEYVILTEATNFEKKDASTETIVLMRDKDGKWKTAAYFIK